MPSEASIWIVVCAVGALVGVSVELLWRMLKAGLDRSKSWVVLLSGDTSNVDIHRVKLRDKRFTPKGTKQTYILGGHHRRSCNLGAAAYIAHKETGAAIRAPSTGHLSKAASGPKPEYVNMLITDPEFTYRELQTNDWRDALEANRDREKDPWYVQLAPMALIGLVIVIGMLGAVLYLLQKGGSA